MPSLASHGRNGWTGGQASLARIALGTCLLAIWICALFEFLPGEAREPGALSQSGDWNITWWEPDPRSLALVFAGGLTMFVSTIRVALGSAGPIGHVLVMGFVAITALAGRSFHAVPGLIAIWSLAIHMGMPRAPIGSRPARGRVDPGGGWRLPAPLFEIAWIGLGVIATLIAFTLPWPPEVMVDRVAHAALPFALLGIHARTRPAAWLVTTSALVLLTARYGHPLAAVGTFASLLVFIDPAWIAPKRRDDEPLVFYDGACGLCHGFVRLLLAEDVDGRLRYAPLQGSTFTERVPEATRTDIPDSIVLWTNDGTLRLRSAAALELLARLGGLWRVVASVAWCVPAPLRDLAYDGVARVRARIFARPDGACPILPPELAARFDV